MVQLRSISDVYLNITLYVNEDHNYINTFVYEKYLFLFFCIYKCYWFFT